MLEILLLFILICLLFGAGTAIHITSSLLIVILVVVIVIAVAFRGPRYF